MPPFDTAAFFKSAAAPEDLPESAGEIAFVGRSNSGKSSSINALLGRKVAFVSKTPGRTRLINFFALGAGRYIVDLPGYGYARVPQAIRAPWGELLGTYLRRRAPLRGLAVVMDIRHPLTRLDRQLLEWFRPTGKPVRVLLTKADKLSRAAAQKALHAVDEELASLSPDFSAQLFSSLKKSGVEEAAETFQGWLDRQPGAAGAVDASPRSDDRGL